MKWLLDLVWPKSPKTMAEVESSYGNSPYENLRPPAWKNEPATVSNGPTVPDVDSLSRQVVALREEVARVKVEAMQAILEARHEAARDAAEWRGERDALAQRLERAETSAKWQTDERKKWEEQNLYEMMQTENRVSMMNLRHGLAIETLEKANADKEARLKHVESFFPVGWVPGTTYSRHYGDMYISVYPSLVDANHVYNFTVSSAKNAHVGMTDAKGFATLSEAMAESERLAEELRVAMEERTVIGAPVVKQDNEAVEVSASVSSDSPKARGLQSFPVSAFGKAAS